MTKLTPWRGPDKAPKAVVRPKLNATVTSSCESDGEPLSLCIWRKMVNGQLQTIVIHDDGIQNCWVVTDSKVVNVAWRSIPFQKPIWQVTGPVPWYLKLEKFSLEVSRLHRVRSDDFLTQTNVDPFCIFLFKMLKTLPYNYSLKGWQRMCRVNLASICNNVGDWDYGFQCVSFSEPERTIYFAARRGGIRAYSTSTSLVTTIVSSS